MPAIATLQALAAQANALSSTSFDLSSFYAVSPMNQDLNGLPYGYRLCGSFALTSRGAGYAVGDVLAAPGYTTQFEVAAVDPAGAIIGLLVLANQPFAPGGDTTTTPAWPAFNDPAPGPLTSLSSSGPGNGGAGAAISFSVAQVGPSQAYAFPDYSPGVGCFTGFFIAAAGDGYRVGDNLTLPGARVSSGTLPVTVSAVNASGAITAFSLPDASYASVPIQLPPNPQALPASGGAGAGAIFGGLFILPPRPAWLAELNRLRNAVWNLPGVNASAGFLSAISPAALCVSGPWPVGGPTDNYADTWFYFADSGAGASVSVASSFAAAGPFSAGLRTNAVAALLLSAAPAPLYYYPLTTKQRFAFVVGGVDALPVSGAFHISAEYVRGGANVIAFPGPTSTVTLDATDPTTLLSVNLAPEGGYHAFPGSVSIAVQSPDSGFLSQGIVTIAIAVNATLSPGRYELEVVVPPLPDDSIAAATGAYTTRTRIFLNSSSPLGDGSGGMGKLFGPVAASIQYRSAVAANGIHNALPIYKIQLPGDALTHGPGLLYVQDLPNNSWNVPDTPGGAVFSTPITYAPEKIFGSGWSISTSTPGFWSAFCPALASLNVPGAAAMPWNLIRTKYASAGNARVNPMLLGDQAPNVANAAQISNAYDQAATVEAQSEPPVWVANRWFSAGFTILDANGNLQMVAVAGVSAATPPAAGNPIPNPWAATVGATTTDGSVSWTCARVFPPALSLQPAPHRRPDLPRYPVYWLGETLPRLLPPTASGGLTVWGAWNQWQLNRPAAGILDPGWQQTSASDSLGMAHGWWIYRVSINRISNASGAVPVTLGCLRAGVFSAFGSFATGQTLSVLWPVFTSNALVYQCTERVDVQALAIAAGNTVASGPTVGPPMCAAFFTDTAALLALIP
jgi:hypothetical protein